MIFNIIFKITILNLLCYKNGITLQLSWISLLISIDFYTPPVVQGSQLEKFFVINSIAFSIWQWQFEISRLDVTL